MKTTCLYCGMMGEMEVKDKYFFDGVDYLRFREAFDAVTEEEIRRILMLLRPENACTSVIVPR